MTAYAKTSASGGSPRLPALVGTGRPSRPPPSTDGYWRARPMEQDSQHSQPTTLAKESASGVRPAPPIEDGSTSWVTDRLLKLLQAGGRPLMVLTDIAL